MEEEAALDVSSNLSAPAGNSFGSRPGRKEKHRWLTALQCPVRHVSSAGGSPSSHDSPGTSRLSTPTSCPTSCPTTCLFAGTGEAVKDKGKTKQLAAAVAVELERMGLLDLPSNSRLIDLPTVLLWDISERVGRPSRKMCKAVRDLFSHPHELRLRGDDNDPDLLGLLTNPSLVVNGITAMSVSQWPQGVPRDAGHLLGLVCHTFPRLTELRLRGAYLETDGAVTGGGLGRLAPLGSSLTALELGLNGTCIQGLCGLTGLRSLSLDLKKPDDHGGWVDLRQAMQHWPSVLRGLTQLTKLDVRLHDSWFPAVEEGWWVQQLASAAPRLVSLGMTTTVEGWDFATAASLRGLSDLQSVQLHMTSLFSSWPSSGPAHFFRDWEFHYGTGALELTAAVITPRCNALLLPRLTNLAALDLSVSHSPLQAQAAWLAVAAQTGLRRLRLAIDGPWAMAPAVSALGALAGLQQQCLVDLCLEAQDWDPASILPCIALLTQLESLRLARRGAVASPAWPEAATAQLAGLTRMTRLDVSEPELPPDILLHVTSLARLRDLSLGQPPPGVGQPAWGCQDLEPLGTLHLTRLQLRGVPLAPGAGLAAVRRMGALQDLALESLHGLEDGWHLALLPLPCRLRYLRIHDAAATAEARAALGAAAQSADCNVSFRWREACNASAQLGSDLGIQA